MVSAAPRSRPSGRRWGRSCSPLPMPAAAPGRPAWAARPAPALRPPPAPGPADGQGRRRPPPPRSAPARTSPRSAAAPPARRRPAPAPAPALLHRRRAPPPCATPCAGPRAPAVMQVQLRRYAARRELAAATRRRSQELVSGTAKSNRSIFWKSMTRGRRRRIVGTQRRWFESKIPQRKRPQVSPELWSTTLPSDIRPPAPALADTRPGGSALRSPDPADSEGVTELDDLYQAFSKEQLAPVWTQVAELMRGQPTPSPRPHVWRWKKLS